MTDKNDDDEDLTNQSDDYSDELSLKSSHSFAPALQDDEENSRRTPSSLNNYSILPPIRSGTTKDESPPQQYFIKHLQEKYHANDPQYDRNGDLGNEAKLDDAYLKMKRLDKALDEAFEKEKQVKIETMSLMKKLRTEMQSMTVSLNDDSQTCSHTQSNLKRFLALDDEILKLDGNVLDDDQPHLTESIFKTQLSDPLGDSNGSTKTDRESVHSNTKMPQLNKKKKSSLSSNSTTSNRDKSKKTKVPEKDFVKRNIQLAKELGGTWALTDDERQRLNELLQEDEEENAVALPHQSINGYVPSSNEMERLKEIDDLLEQEYYNPLLNHQLRRNHEPDVDYTTLQQITNEEDELMENPFGERVLKETRLKREHMHRLKQIDERLEHLHQPPPEKKIEAILSDEQLNELLGQCAVDEMKQRYSFLHRQQGDPQEIDFNHLSDYALTHYVENNQGPMITDEIIQLLISEASQEGIAMREFPDDETEDLDSARQQQAQALSMAPALDRPLSSASTASYLDVDHRQSS